MDWYIPITIIPGIGLIIMSTSGILLDLNAEISKMEAEQNKKVEVIKAKVKQLIILSFSISFQYLGVLFFLISGLIGSVLKVSIIPKSLLIIGVAFVSISIILLLIYSLKAIKIRHKHLEL